MTGRLLHVVVLAVALVGCGSSEEAALPAPKADAGTKSGPVTKPSGEKMEQTSEQATVNEEKGG